MKGLRRNRFVAIFVASAMALFVVYFTNINISNAATFNDADDGNWNIGATWGNGGDDVEGSGYPGSSDTITVDSHTVTMTADHSASSFTLSGGTLTMDSYTLTVSVAFTESSGTFNEDTGTLYFTGSGGSNVNVATSLTLNNFTTDKISNVIIASGDTLVVNGTTALNGSGEIRTGTLNAKGAISIGSSFNGGTATLLIDGSSSQSFTVPAGAALPAITLNQSATTIDFDVDADVTLESVLTLQAGTFTSTNGTLTISKDFDASAGGTFNHNEGTILTTGGNITFNVDSSLTLNNLTYNQSGNLIIASGDTLVVNGTTALNGSSELRTGALNAKGAISIGSAYAGGSATLVIDGSSSQSFTIPTGVVSFNGITLNQSATTIDFDSGIDLTMDGDLVLQAGTFTASSGTLTFGSGKDLDTSAGGTFNHNEGTIVFTGSTNAIDVDSSLTFNNLTINKTSLNDFDIASGDTLVINGTMTFTDGDIDIGTINAKGDVVIASTADGGTANWTIGGTGAQTLTGSTGLMTDSGTVTIANTGVASLGANTTITTLTIAANGTFDLAGFNLTETTFTNSGTLQLEGGETVNEPDTHSASSTVEYNDTSSAQTLKTWTYTNLKINAAGQTVSMGTTETLDEGLTVKAGTFDVADNALSINATTTINGGTMMTGTGVVTFGDNSADVVRITSGTLEIESDDTTNDIVKTAGTWTNSGGTISYTGNSVTTNLLSALSPYYALTINDEGNASTYTLDGAINASSTLTITGGTLVTGGKAMILDDDFVNSDIFTHGGGTVIFASTTNTTNITSGGSAFNKLIFNDTGGSATYRLQDQLNASSTLTITGGILDANGKAMIIGGNWTNSDTFTANSNSVTFATTTTATITLTSGGSPFSALTLDDSGNAMTVNLQDQLNASSTLTITGGTLDANGKAMIIEGDWVNNDTFTANANTVTLIGTNQTISGSNTFYNFTKSTTTADTLTFANGTTQTVTNIATLNGADGQLLSLVSDSPGTAWIFDPQLTRTFDFLAVTDSNNTNTTEIDCYTSSTCTDSGGNTNWAFSAPVVAVAEDTPSSGGGGVITGLIGSGGNLTFYNTITETITDIIESIPDTTDAVIDDVASVIGAVGDAATDFVFGVVDDVISTIFGDDIPPDTLLTDEFLDDSLVLDNVWSLLDTNTLPKFIIAPLPDIILALANKFPEFRDTLEELNINRIADFDRLRGTSFNLSTGPDLDDLPSEIVFSSSGSSLLEFTLGFKVTEDSEVVQTIRTASGHTLELVVRPEYEAESVVGYLILKEIGRPALNLPLNLQLASALFAVSDTDEEENKVPTEIDEEFLIQEFEYTDLDNDGIYTANIISPLVSGNYEIITVIDYQDDSRGQKEIRFILLVDPEGYIYESVDGKEVRIPNALVRIFWKNPENSEFELWPADDFNQRNPQITDVTGEYSFLVPVGTYYIIVESDEYVAYRTDEFEVVEGRGVHINIEVEKIKTFEISPWVLTNTLLVLILMILIYNLYKNRRYNKIKK